MQILPKKINQESTITFKDFSSIWLETYQNTGKVKVSTVRVRKHEIGRLMPYFEYLKMKDITGTMYQDALNDLKAKDYKDNTLEGIHCAGRCFHPRPKLLFAPLKWTPELWKI